MKKIFTLIFTALNIYCFSQTTLTENFDSYQAGDLISVVGANWNTWTAGSATEDIPVSDALAFSGSNSLHTNVTLTQDVIWDFGQTFTEGTVELSMQMYVVNGDIGYYNIQAVSPVGSVWAYSVIFEAGTASITGESNLGTNIGTFAYDSDTWFETGASIDIENNSWNITYNGVVMTTFMNDNNSLASMNIFSADGANMDQQSNFYVDDMSFEHIPPVVIAPTTSFTHSQGTGISFNFTNTSVGDPGTYSWDFGDTNTSSDENPIHTFAMDGTYDVCLTVTNSAGSDMNCQSVGVAELAIVDFTEITTDNSVDFNGVVFGTADSYLWDFGDGNTATTENTTHTFAALGTYNVCFAVTNVAGTSEICKDVVISTISALQNFESINISLSPNPANDFINLSGELFRVKNLILISEDGKQQLVNAENGLINISKLAKGNYFLALQFEDGKMFVEQFIKM